MSKRREDKREENAHVVTHASTLGEQILESLRPIGNNKNTHTHTHTLSLSLSLSLTHFTVGEQILESLQPIGNNPGPLR